MERKITIEADGIYREDYQMHMLKCNQVTGFLKVQGQGVDGKTRYEYDVSGKTSVKAMYEKGSLSAADLKAFLQQFIEAIKETENFLLNVNCILIEPEYIFYEEERFYFCYYPPAVQDIWEAFKKLTEYFVKQADYKEHGCIQMVFTLHKGVLVENYSLEKLTQACIEAAGQPGYEEQKKERQQEAFSYDTKDHDWIAEQEIAGNIMEETENLWTPVKKFLNRHKKPKWGDWDGLYIEEEEL